jgi:hypothetical protein
MSGGDSLVERFGQSDWSLSALLVLLVVDIFILGPLIQFQETPGVLTPAVFSLFLLSGVAIVLRSRAATAIVGIFAAVNFVIRWTSHIHPSITLARADTVSSLVFCVLLGVVILVRAFRPGPINLHRIQGVIAVYLLLVLTWTFAYTLVALGDPAAFSFPAAVLNLQNLHARLLYFSTITLTTVGYGDITPVNPVARSLAAFEGITGQLFPVILLARLVSMELHYRQQRERHL